MEIVEHVSCSDLADLPSVDKMIGRVVTFENNARLAKHAANLSRARMVLIVGKNKSDQKDLRCLDQGRH